MVPIRWLATFLAHSPRRRALWTAVLLAGGMFGAALTVLAQSGTPTIGFSPSSYTVKRTDGVVNITVTLSSASTNVVTAQWATRDISATATQDYVPGSGTVVFPPGVVSQQIQVAIIPTTETADEQFAVDLSNPQNATYSMIAAFVTITNTASGPSATVSFDYPSWSYSESKLVATISVTMSGTPTGQVTVKYDTSDGTAKAGVNYGSASGLLTWQPSEVNVSKTFTVPLIDDGKVDPTLTVNLVLSSPVNATLGSQPTATLNILDTDGICP